MLSKHSRTGQATDGNTVQIKQKGKHKEERDKHQASLQEAKVR